MALQLQEHQNVQILAQKEQERIAMMAKTYCADKSPMHSSPESADYRDGMSIAGSMRSQVGYLASLANSLGIPCEQTFFGE